MLVVTQVLSLVQSAALAALTLRRHDHGAAACSSLQVAQGVINAFDTPARQAFVVRDGRGSRRPAERDRAQLVDGQRQPHHRPVDRRRRSSPRSAKAGASRIDAVSYVGVIASLLAMRLDAARAPRAAATAIAATSCATGWPTCVDSVPIRTALILLAIVSTSGMPYTVLMPVDRRRRCCTAGPNTLGLLMAAIGRRRARRRALPGVARVGARPRPRRSSSATLALRGGLIAFSSSRTSGCRCVLLPFVGAGFMVQMASTNTILQTIVEERLRGRVMAFYTMAFLGTAPIGSLLGRGLRRASGRMGAIGIGAVVCIAAGAWFAVRAAVAARTDPPDLHRARHHRPPPADPARPRREIAACPAIGAGLRDSTPVNPGVGSRLRSRVS